MKRTCLNCGATDIPDDALVCSCGSGDLAAGAVPEVLIELVAPETDAWWPPETARSRVLRYSVAAVVVGFVVAVVINSSHGDLGALTVAPSDTAPGQQPIAVATTTTPTTASITSTTMSTTSTTAETPSSSGTVPSVSPSAIPPAITSLLSETRVLDHDDFTDDLDRWDLAGFAGRWETLPGRIVVGTRTTAAGGGLLSDFAIEPGTAVMLRTSFSVRTAAKAFLDSGAVGDSGYRRFGLRMGAEWHAEAVVTEHYEGATELTDLAPVGDLVPRVGQEYYVVLAVDDDGTLAFGVWPVDGAGHAVEIRDYGASWAARSWRMHVGVDEGILNVFEFWLVGFSSVG